ncbi:MAG TPA: MHYT domain-containing protein, partial [Dongiaceae bacterium]
MVVVAAILCIFACLTAVNLIGRAADAQGYTRQLWLAGGGFVSGGAIWATHFVAMLAFRPELPFGYDIRLTIASVFIAISLCWLGLQVALLSSLTTGPGDPAQATRKHVIGIKRGGAIIAAIGGAIMGCAIASMHFVGMAALRVPGELHWDGHYVLASIVIGIVGGGLAIRTILGANSVRNRVLGGGLLVLAICGLHFTAMSAVTIELNPTIAIPDAVLDPKWLAVSIAIITILIVALALTCAMVDRHLALRSAQEEKRLRAHIVELEAAQLRLE